MSATTAPTQFHVLAKPTGAIGNSRPAPGVSE